MWGCHKDCEEKRWRNRERALLAQNEKLLESGEVCFLAWEAGLFYYYCSLKPGSQAKPINFFFFFFSAWERKTVSLLITLLTHSVWVFHTKQFPGHQRVCPTVQFSYDTNYPELAQIPQDKGSVPQDFPPPSASNHKFHVVICTSVDCYKLRVPLTSSGSIICYNGSWNLGKHYRGKARWRGTQREDWKGSGCRRFCPCGIGVHHPPST